MNSTTILACLGFCLYLFSCETKIPSCEIKVEDLLKSNNEKLFAVNTENGVVAYRDKGTDSIEGGYYTFFKNGQLDEFVFFTGADTVIYKEQYDSVGHLMYIEGSPLLHKSAELIHDSLVLKYYLLVLNKKYKSIPISISKNKPMTLDLAMDTLFSNVHVAKYIVKGLTKEQDIDCYLNIEYQNVCTHESKSLADSIFLHYKPGK